MKDKGLLCFHQGWTDIINSLSLINYYCQIYKELHVVVRQDSKPFVDFYTRTLSNCVIHYVEKDVIARMDFMSYAEGKDRLFHGCTDIHRDDAYRHKFSRSMSKIPIGQPGGHFVEKFFSPYDISYDVRVDYFDFARDEVLEDQIKTQFLVDYGDKPYILYHDQQDFRLNLEKQEGKNYINLDGITDNPFLYIKVIQDCEALHLVDSIWATFVYLISSKIPSLSNKPINLYWFGRSGGLLNRADDKILSPYNPKNFNIIGK